MRFEIVIHTDNSAFTDAEGTEVARIIRGVAATVEETSGDAFKNYGVTLFDVNGNKVGAALVWSNT